MGLADVIHHLANEYISYEKHSVAYASVSTALGVVGGVASGVIAATTYGANAPYIALVAIGGYIVTRVLTALPLHLKNIYNLVTGAYSKEAKPANLAPALAT